MSEAGLAETDPIVPVEAGVAGTQNFNDRLGIAEPGPGTTGAPEYGVSIVIAVEAAE